MLEALSEEQREEVDEAVSQGQTNAQHTAVTANRKRSSRSSTSTRTATSTTTNSKWP